MKDAVEIARYRYQQERVDWVRIEDIQAKHHVTDGEIISAWRDQRIAPAVELKACEFWPDPQSGLPPYIHLGGPIRVTLDALQSFSEGGDICEIRSVWSPVLLGGNGELIDPGRHLVLNQPIRARLGTLWVDQRTVDRIFERPAEAVMAEALAELRSPKNEPPRPKRGETLTAQIDALIATIDDLGYDRNDIPDGSKAEIFKAVMARHPTLFERAEPTRAWREASQRGLITHHQKKGRG